MTLTPTAGGPGTPPIGPEQLITAAAMSLREQVCPRTFEVRSQGPIGAAVGGDRGSTPTASMPNAAAILGCGRTPAGAS